MSKTEKKSSKRRFGLYQSDWHLPRRPPWLGWLILCLYGQSLGSIKKWHWYNRRHSGFSFLSKQCILVKEFPTLPKKDVGCQAPGTCMSLSMPQSYSLQN